MEKILCIIRTSTVQQELISQHNEMNDYCISLGYSSEQIVFVESAGASARKLNEKYLQFIDQIKFPCLILWHSWHRQTQLLGSNNLCIATYLLIPISNGELIWCTCVANCSLQSWHTGWIWRRYLLKSLHSFILYNFCRSLSL